jgi:type II secretory pathway component HofQ
MRRFVLVLGFVAWGTSPSFAQQPQPAVITIPADAADKLPIEATVRLAQNQPDLRVTINQARGPQTPAPIPPPAPPKTPPQPVAPAAPPPPAAPRKLPTQNVRIDVTITDSFGTTPTKKTIAALVADARTGSIRSSMAVPVVEPQFQSAAVAGSVAVPIQHVTYQNILLNVDASPEVLADGRIFMGLSVQYTPDTPQEPGGSARPGSLNESLQVVLPDGKQTLIAQSADPRGDRKVTLEVTATVVK